MEYHLNKRSVSQRRNALDTASEQSVDFDLTLPDYCPDIERILSCNLDPKIYIANVSGDRLNIEGGACVRVMYADGDSGCVRELCHLRVLLLRCILFVRYHLVFGLYLAWYPGRVADRHAVLLFV